MLKLRKYKGGINRSTAAKLYRIIQNGDRHHTYARPGQEGNSQHDVFRLALRAATCGKLLARYNCNAGFKLILKHDFCTQGGAPIDLSPADKSMYRCPSLRFYEH